MSSALVNQSVLASMDRFGDIVEDKIARDTEENRKGNFSLRIVKKDGTVPENIKVSVKQTSHEFRFGAPPFLLHGLDTDAKNARYEEALTNIANYAIIPLYWDGLEPVEGAPRFAKDSPFVYRRPPLLDLAEFCRANQMRMKGHCLIYNSFQPDWIPSDHRELRMRIDRRLEEIADVLGNEMEDADVINEMYTVYKNCYKGNGMRNLCITDDPDHEKWGFELARRHFPHMRLFWNEGIEESFGPVQYKGPRSLCYMMYEKALSQNVPLDGIGAQFHLYYDEEKTLSHFCNPLRLFDFFDCYEKLGIPVQISEVSVPTWEENAKAEEIQGEILRRLYRIFFSRKSCEGISYWNLVDKTAYTGENRFLTGLLHNDLTPKHAYEVLSDLIHHEWHTEAVLGDGETKRFRGYYGHYLVTIETGSEKIERTVRLYKEDTGYDNRLGDFRTKEIVID